MSVTDIRKIHDMSVTVTTYYGAMERWEPNARERLEQAALDLYLERGYEQTTVVEIAKQAGVSERTFFRYFADKPEVLFGGVLALQEHLVSTILKSEESRTAFDAVIDAFEEVGSYLQERREYALKLHTIVNANIDLQEREQMKFATLSNTIATQLRKRNVKEPAASLAAEAGISVFKIAIERWVKEPGPSDLPHLIRDSLRELRSVTQGQGLHS